jgi:TonB family protein
MRVLVVDQDSTLLTEISRLLGEYFTIDAVTNKLDCLDLVRSNPYEVIVAGERLEDGSGLELLGQLARTRPDMLRIFAAENERLHLLKGRLGPFGLFRTLTYPIEPRQLLAALSAAAGIDLEAPEPEAAEAEPTASAQTVTQPEARSEAPAVPRPRARPSSQAQARTRHPALSGHSNNSNQGWREARQPTAEALAAANRLEIVSRARSTEPPKGYPLRMEPSPARSAFLVAAGVVLVLGGLWLAFKIFGTRDQHLATHLNPARIATFPPEVVTLVAETETAFQQGNLKDARTDVAAMQQIAPNHPQLPTFVSQLQKLEASTRESTRRLVQRHTSETAPVRSSVPAPAPAETAANDTEPTRRRPGTPPSDQDTTPPTTSLQPGATLPSADTPTREARLIQRVEPDYPPDAERGGVEGSVDLSFTVDPDGRVTDVIVDHSEPSDIFDRAAALAVRRWRYEPKLMSGTPVEEHLQAHLVFKLNPAHH